MPELENYLSFVPQWPYGMGYSDLFPPNRYLESPLFRKYRAYRPPALLLPPSYFWMPVMPIPDVLYPSFDRYFPPSGVNPFFDVANPLLMTRISPVLEEMLG